MQSWANGAVGNMPCEHYPGTLFDLVWCSYGVFPAVGVWFALSVLNTYQLSPREDDMIYAFPFAKGSSDQMVRLARNVTDK